MNSATTGPQLTVRGRGVLAAAGGLLVAAKLFGSAELAGLAVAAGAAVGAALVVVRRAPLTYRAERRLTPSRVAVGDAASARLGVTNVSRAQAVRPAEATDRLESPVGAVVRCLVPGLPAGATAEARYDLPTERRGVVTVGPLGLTVSDRFGLVERRVEAAGSARLVVHPRIHAVLPPPGSPTQEARGGTTRTARSIRGDEFFALREYEVGDDLRRVHWRSTARRGDLMLRQDELRFGEVATVLLDTRAAVHTADSFERALEAAASVAAALVEDRRRIRFLTTGGFEVELDGARTGASGRAEGKWGSILEHLAAVTPDRGGPERFALAVRSIGRDPSGPLAAVVGAASPAELSALAALRSRLGHVTIVHCAPEAAPAGVQGGLTAAGAVVVPAGPGDDFAAGWNAALPAAPLGRAGASVRRDWSATGGARGPRGTRGVTDRAPDPVPTRSARGSAAGLLPALGVVSLIVAAGCSRLFEGTGWVVPAAVAVAGAHGLGWLTRRWPAPAALAAQAGGLLVLLAERVGGHTAFGVPTPATVSGLLRAAGRAPATLRAAIVPAPATAELLLLLLAGLWVAVAAADWLARRRRAGLLAVLPLVAFPVLVAAIGTGRGRLLLTFGFTAATALYAAVARRAGGWTVQAELRRPVPAGPPHRGRVALGPAVAVGVTAVVLGPLVPGVSGAMVDVYAFGVTLDVSRAEFNPLVDIQPQLLAKRRTELFTVRSESPAYWRLTALDRFDGRSWSPSRPALFRTGTRSAATAGTATLEQEYRLSGLESPWLPAAGTPVRVRASGARIDLATDSLVTKKGSKAVRSYRVESRLPPDPAEDGPSPALTGLDAKTLARHLALPRDFPERVRELARRLTAGARTPYEQAAALEDSLRVGFIYDETVPAGASSDALTQFLFSSRRGYCEQFAGAFAALARSIGLPTRLAVGFAPGTYEPAAGVWRVTTREAHAWPEVFLPGHGWTPFEPTPGRVLPDPDDRVQPSTTVERLASSRSTGGVGAAAVTRIDPEAAPGVDAGPAGRGDGLAGAVGGRGRLWWMAAAALGLVGAVPAAKARRRSVRRRARGAEAVLAAWSEVLDRLSEAGLPRRVTETPLEFAGRAGRVRPGAAPALRRLAGLVNSAAYAPGPEAGCGGPPARVPEIAAEAWAASDRVVRALDAHDSRWVCWRRRLDPRPLLRAWFGGRLLGR